MPLIPFKLLTTKSLRFLKASDLSCIKFCCPFNASTAAAWLMDDGLEVDWVWVLW